MPSSRIPRASFLPLSQAPELRSSLETHSDMRRSARFASAVRNLWRGVLLLSSAHTARISYPFLSYFYLHLLGDLLPRHCLLSVSW